MKLLCLFGRHKLQQAFNHPDRKLGYHIVECTRCPAAFVSDPGVSGSHPILNTQAAIERDTAIAVQREHH